MVQGKTTLLPLTHDLKIGESELSQIYNSGLDSTSCGCCATRESGKVSKTHENYLKSSF